MNAERATIALHEDFDLLSRHWDPVITGHAGKATLLVTGLPLPTLNCVMAEPDADAAHADLLLRHAAEGGFIHSLMLRPRSRPELPQLAEARGMSRAGEIPLMVAMRAADEVLREVVARAERLTVRQVGPEESSVHVAVGSAGFEAPAFIFECLMPPKAMAAPQVSCFVGYVAEQPVTTAVAVTHGDHVGIYSVATSPEHRGRGYGAAVTARACLAGFAAGAEFAYLQSSPIGYGVYRSLGFQTVESWELWVGEPAGAGSARG